jgi:hypothetical protein
MHGKCYVTVSLCSESLYVDPSAFISSSSTRSFQPNERERQIAFAQNTMNRIGYQLIAEKKAAVRAEKHGAHIEKDDVQGIFYVLVWLITMTLSNSKGEIYLVSSSKRTWPSTFLKSSA